MIEKILLFFILVTLSFFFACKDKSPIYQLEDEQFIKILADMHISESASQHLSLSVRAVSYTHLTLPTKRIV